MEFLLTILVMAVTAAFGYKYRATLIRWLNDTKSDHAWRKKQLRRRMEDDNAELAEIEKIVDEENKK